MNFEKWYKNWCGRDYYDGQPNSGELKIGWDACKNEILEIIKKHSNNPLNFSLVTDNIIKDIEKL